MIFWKKIVRVTAYCQRLRNNDFKPHENNFGPLQVMEIDYANVALIKMVHTAKLFRKRS